MASQAYNFSKILFIQPFLSIRFNKYPIFEISKSRILWTLHNVCKQRDFGKVGGGESSRRLASLAVKELKSIKWMDGREKSGILIRYYTSLRPYYRTWLYYRFWHYYPNFGGFHRTLQRVRLANRGRLLLRTPGPVPFGTCICSNVETILSWTCHVYGPFEFRTSLGTFILLINKGQLGMSTMSNIPNTNSHPTQRSKDG